MRMCAKGAPPQVVGGVRRQVRILSEGCVAFLWGEECKLEVLTEGLLCGVDIQLLGDPGVSRKCAVSFP